MSFASSQPQLSIKAHHQPKLPDCMFEKPRNDRRICSVEIQRLPAINERRKKNCKKGVTPDKSPKRNIKQDINLPKLSTFQHQMDAGEPNGSLALEHSVEQFSFDSSEKCFPINRSQWLESSSTDTVKTIGLLQYEEQNIMDTASRIKTHAKNEKPEEIEESNALKRWKYWMENKRAMQDYLSKQIGRDPQDLLLQEPDKYREVMEQKLMHWYSRIPNPDKWRGPPARWKPALRIRDNDGRGLYPQYCLVKSKVEKGERPELEFIGLPKTIKKEKGLIFDQVTGKEEKKKFPNRVHCFEEKESCSSHEIEMSELEIIGEKIFLVSEEDENSKSSKIYPQIIEPEPKCNDHQSRSQLMKSAASDYKCLQRPSIFCLAIDEDEIKYEVGIDYSQAPDRILDWQVNFDVNITGSIVEKILRIENRGTMTVRYDWVFPETVQKLSLNALQRRQYDPWFFFNKNSGFFLPGQIYDLKFYFHAKTPGVRKEKWYLKTTPPLSPNLKFATITLSGVATEGLSTLAHSVKMYVHSRTLLSNISAIIDVILYKVFDRYENLEHIEYRSIFTEKELFEHHNPQYFYHSVIVRQLKEFLKEIPDNIQTEWDFSLCSLVDLIKIHKTGKERTDALFDISQKAKALLRPNYVSVRSVNKYRMTYAVLCKMTNFMEEDYFYLRNLVSERVEESTIWSEAGEVKETTVSSIITAEEMDESYYKKEIFQIKPISLMFFQTLFYLKVYHRMCEAIEHIAGILETRKFLEPWKQVTYNLTKPRRTAKFSADLVLRKNSTCQTKSVCQEKSQKDY